VTADAFFKRPQVFYRSTKVVVKQDVSVFWWWSQSEHLVYLGRALQKFQRPFGISKHLKHNACEYEQFNLLIFPVFNALSLACAFLNLSDLGETQTLCRPQQNGLFVFLKNLCARLMPAYGRSKHENEAGLS